MNTIRKAKGKRSLLGVFIITLLCMVISSTYANPSATTLAKKVAELAAKQALKELLSEITSKDTKAY